MQIMWNTNERISNSDCRMREKFLWKNEKGFLKRTREVPKKLNKFLKDPKKFPKVFKQISSNTKKFQNEKVLQRTEKVVFFSKKW